jgi:GAF domain-containing protein
VSDGDGDAAQWRRDRAIDALVEVAARAAAAERIAPAAGELALRAVAEAAVAAVRVNAASIALHDAATDQLTFRAAAGPHGSGVIGLSIGAHDGIAGYVFSTGQPLAVADAVADPRFERSTAERTGYLPRSLLAVPLIDDDGLLGVMELLDRRDGEPFDLADIELAGRMAAVATAVARATRLDRDAVTLLGAVLAAVGSADGDPLDEARLETLLDEIAERLSVDDPVWRLADRIGRLRSADPDDLDLAVAWLDALLAHARRRTGAAGRARG